MRFLTFLLAVAATPLAAQQFVYPRADAKAFTVQKNIPYDGDLKFDLYRPAGDAVVPVVIFANVGIAGMKEWPGYVGWGEAVGSSGLAAVHYDAAQGKGPENFASLVAALRMNAGKHRLDPSRVVIWGGSANVRLAFPAAMDSRNDFIKGAILYYGYGEAPRIRTDLPVYFVRVGLDSVELNRGIDALIARVLAANAPWTIENYGGGLHGFDILNDNDVSRELIRRSIDFMKRVTTPDLSRAYAAASNDASLGASFKAADWPVVIEGYRRKVIANPSDGESHLRLGLALLETGRYAEAHTALDTAWRLGRRGPRDTALPAARAAALAGDEERALAWIDILLRTPFVTKQDIENDKAFASLKETEAFKRRMQ